MISHLQGRGRDKNCATQVRCLMRSCARQAIDWPRNSITAVRFAEAVLHSPASLASVPGSISAGPTISERLPTRRW